MSSVAGNNTFAITKVTFTNFIFFRSKQFLSETSKLFPYSDAGLINYACLISMPDENAFAIAVGAIANKLCRV